MSISETSSRPDSQLFSKSSPSFYLGSMYDNNEDDDSVNCGDRVSEQIRAELERWQKDNTEYQKYRQEVDNVVLNDNNASNEPNTQQYRQEVDNGVVNDTLKHIYGEGLNPHTNAVGTPKILGKTL
jgi:hypothetical protein